MVAFNTAERWSEDVSADVAEQLRGRCDLQMRELPSTISNFVERHEMPDRRQIDTSIGLVSIRNFLVNYLCGMRRVEFDGCQAGEPRSQPGLIGSTIKHDGYRLTVHIAKAKRVRLFTRNGHDWTDRYPLIVETLRNRIASFVMDGEAVLLGVDGRSDFDGLHIRKFNDEVQFYAFDQHGPSRNVPGKSFLIVVQMWRRRSVTSK